MVNNVTQTKANSKSNVLNMVLIAVLAALVIMLTLSGYGYIPTGLGFTISILSIPVAVAAVNIGPGAGAVLGFVFGATSFATCFLGTDPLGAAMVAVNPFTTAVICFIPRILMGWLCGLIFKGMQKVDKTKSGILSYGVACVSASLLNTLLFLTGLWLLFGTLPAVTAITGGSSNLFTIMLVLGGVNGLIEIAAALILGTAVTKAIAQLQKRMH